MEGSDLLHAVFMATIAVVVGRVTVYEAIGQDEVDGGIVPVKRRRGGRLGALKQQQTIAAEGGLQGDFAAADGRDIAAVEIADLAALGEGFADVDGQRFSVPLRTLADLRRRGAGLFSSSEIIIVGVPERVSTSGYTDPGGRCAIAAVCRDRAPWTASG